jgi:hypothetical protein
MHAAPTPPLVSILINNYNYARFVMEAVRSALDQTGPEVEVVVVDDGSTDDSLACLATIADPRVRVIAQRNGGQGAAYNTGFAAARGEYVIFLDADDLLDPGVVADAVAAFAPGVVKVQFQLEVIDRDGGAIGRLHPPQIQDAGCREAFERFGSYASPPGSGNVFARRFLDEVMPIHPAETFRYGADAWPIMLAPFFGEIANLPVPGGRYRIHSTAEGMPRVVGNANADPVKSLRNLTRTTLAIADELARRGLAGPSVPSLPPPALLRSWALARLTAADPSSVPERLFGCRFDAATLLRSVGGWAPYPLRKKLAYVGWLAALGLPPRRVSRSLLRLMLRAGWA